MAKLSKARLTELMSHFTDLAKRDRYLHWDELRRRPPPHALSHGEWWCALKLARTAARKAIPLKDKTGTPFSFNLPDRVMSELHEIDRGLGFAVDLPDAVTRAETRDQYILSSLIQESITSSQLEGAATTREVAKEMLRTGRPPRDKGERMIVNNYHTMQRIRALRDQPLTPERVLELHVLVTSETLDKPDAAGRFRRDDENVRVEDIEGTVFHVPPAAGELPKRLEAMCAFANGTTPDFFVHPVLRAIGLHFWLAYDHPFVDGNGRCARALFYWSMLRQGYQLFEFISISQILLHAPARYARAFLHTETDENDLTYFVLHQVEVIGEAVQALHHYAQRKTRELRAAEKCLRGLDGLNHRQQALLAHSLRDQSARYVIEGHRRSHGVAFQTARDDLFDLVERGLLVARKEGRTNAFYAPADLSEKLARLTEARGSASPDSDSTLPLHLEPKSK
ncbi:MAG TPA: Fic family protein [Opitutaceae bacterium]|nr:Fic family protein [Opitutaceae bacterium]